MKTVLPNKLLSSDSHDGEMKLYKGASNAGSAKKMIFVDATAEFTR